MTLQRRRNKWRQSASFCLTFLIVTIAGCASQPVSTYPVLERNLETDAALDCAGLGDQILKANAIRDAIYEEHSDVIEDAVLESAANIAIDPVIGAFESLFAAGSASRAAKKYMEAATAAGVRMEQLLIYKERDDCPTGATADPALTDALVLNELRNLQSELEQEEINDKNYLTARRQLLDDLR